jgi:hypothetical protein
LEEYGLPSVSYPERILSRLDRDKNYPDVKKFVRWNNLNISDSKILLPGAESSMRAARWIDPAEDLIK